MNKDAGLGEASWSQNPKNPRFTGMGNQQEGSVHNRLGDGWSVGNMTCRQWNPLETTRDVSPEMAGPELRDAEMQGTTGAQESLWRMTGLAAGEIPEQCAR